MDTKVSLIEMEHRIRWSFSNAKRLDDFANNQRISTGVLHYKGHQLKLTLERNNCVIDQSVQTILQVVRLSKFCSSLNLKCRAYWSTEKDPAVHHGGAWSDSFCIERDKTPHKIRLCCNIPSYYVALEGFDYDHARGDVAVLTVELDILSSTTIFPNAESPSGFRHRLWCMKQEDMYTDVTLLTSDKVPVRAHKVILSLSSPVFRAMFSGPFMERAAQEVPLDIPSDTLESLLEYAYLSYAPSITQLAEVTGLIRVFEVADMYMMRNLQLSVLAELKSRLEKHRISGFLTNTISTGTRQSINAIQYRHLLRFMRTHPVAAEHLQDLIVKNLAGDRDTLYSLIDFT